MQLPHPSRMEHSLVLIVFFVCVGVTAALCILGGWHLYLISFSETTIEFYTNKRDAQRMRKQGQVRGGGGREGGAGHTLTCTHMHTRADV